MDPVDVTTAIVDACSAIKAEFVAAHDQIKSDCPTQQTVLKEALDKDVDTIR